jgi:hypothetical protein
MSDTVRIYVNGEKIDVPKIATVLGALEIHDSAAAANIRRGTHVLADSRGLPTTPDSPVYDGAIYRVVSSKQTR